MTPETLIGIASATGYVAGAVADRVAVHRAAQHRTAIAEVHESIDLPVRGGIGRTALRTIVPGVGAGIAAGLLAYSVAPGQIEQPPESRMSIVVDRSGATGLAGEGQTPAERQNSIITTFNTENANSEVIVAGTGRPKVIAPEAVASEASFGTAPLDQAVSLALDRAGAAAADTKKNSGANITVLTYGNTFGQPEPVIEKAKAVGAQLHIVNVQSPEATPPETMQVFTAVAEQTGGKLWSGVEQKPEEIAAGIDADTAPEPGEPVEPPLQGAALAGGLLLAAAGIQYLRNRRNYPFGNEV